ncbi:hypothetical protein CN918_28320 [Priestia megaterium]|nr:hypothetical protein CN918_28320 [Priestia megaterium]
MSQMYRRAKAEKFRDSLMDKLSTMEFNLLLLKSEDKMDGFTTLFNQYKLIFDITSDFCEEFTLEPPRFSDELSTKNISQKELLENMRISHAINELHYQRKFLSHDDMDVANNETLQAILPAIDIDEFFMHCQVDTSLPYFEAVKKMSRQATVYILTALGIKHPRGQHLLDDIAVMEGYVGRRHHFWLKVSDRYYLDLTLAQFTTKSIPYISLFTVEHGDNIYSTFDEHEWMDWIETVKTGQN